MKPLRLFFAVKIPPPMIRDLAHSRDTIRDRIGGRAVRNDMLHITLHFIGNTQPSEITRLTAILDDTAASMHPFQITAKGFGSFRQKKGSLIYAAVSIPETITRQIISLKKKTGTGDMKSFTPHITLLRNVTASKEAQKLTMDRTSLDFTATIKELCLMESRFSEGRPEYAVLHSAALNSS